GVERVALLRTIERQVKESTIAPGLQVFAHDCGADPLVRAGPPGPAVARWCSAPRGRPGGRPRTGGSAPLFLITLTFCLHSLYAYCYSNNAYSHSNSISIPSRA